MEEEEGFFLIKKARLESLSNNKKNKKINAFISASIFFPFYPLLVLRFLFATSRSRTQCGGQFWFSLFRFVRMERRKKKVGTTFQVF